MNTFDDSSQFVDQSKDKKEIAYNKNDLILKLTSFAVAM